RPTPTEAPMARARRLLTRVGLSERLSHRPGQLSGGGGPGGAGGRAALHAAEPVLGAGAPAAPGPAAAGNTAHRVGGMNREEGVAVLVITHAMDLAARMARVLELRDGALIPVES